MEDEDDLLLPYVADEEPDVINSTLSLPTTSTEDPALRTTEPAPATTTTITPAKPEESEKTTHVRAYKLAAPVGALFGRLAKRKQDALAVEGVAEPMDSDDGVRRTNALLLQGLPISHLSTEKIFEYSAYYSSTEVSSLEWVDDQTCVLVYENAAMATAAYHALHKSKIKTDDPAFVPTEDNMDFVPCQPLPMSMWPVEDRLAMTLGTDKSAGAILKAPLNMRWALKTDVKVRNARHQSKYYEKHGIVVAPLSSNSSSDRKRRRGADDDDADVDHGDRGALRRRLDGGRATRERELAELDAELDRFASGEADPPPPPSMEDDTAASAGGGALLDRIGQGRRIAPLPGSRRGPRGGAGRRGREDGEREREGRSARAPRPVADKDALDAELDAFLQRKD